MKTISSLLSSDLSRFIIAECPWMAEQWDPESMGYVFVLDDSDIGKVTSVYTKDWPDVSKSLKKRNNYICNLCGIDMSFHKRLLHVHHINGVKNDNSVSNLRVLCADCHRKQPYHRHLFVRHDDTVLINQLRNEQNIKVDSGWAGIYSLADPALHGVINQLEKHNTPIPEVGINVINNRGNILARLELGWAKKRIAVVISSKSAVTAEQQGWKVWSMRNSLTQLNNLIKDL